MQILSIFMQMIPPFSFRFKILSCVAKSLLCEKLPNLTAILGINSIVAIINLLFLQRARTAPGNHAACYDKSSRSSS